MALQDVKIETGYIIIVDQLMDGLGCGNGKTHTNNVQIQTGNVTYEIVKQEDMLSEICKKQLATLKDVKIETEYIDWKTQTHENVKQEDMQTGICKKQLAM